MATTEYSRCPRVLLVDSRPDEREMYGESLRICGFQMLLADNGADGYLAASEFSPDVVVTDFRLLGPDDGLELTRRLKGSTPTAGLPVIVVSACAYANDRLAATLAGCDRFLPKPCLPDELVTAIEAVLGNRRTGPVEQSSTAIGA